MLSWGAFSHARPDLAAKGRSLLYEYEHGLGLGFLATVRPDGGPRVHPICPLLTDDGLYGFIVPGPKLEDLRRDPRYALHSETFPPPRHDDAFAVTGTAVAVHDPALRRSLTEQFLAERDLTAPWEGFEAQALIEFTLDRCLITLTQAQDDFPSGHTIWHA
jgi:Pyridoxamine 5'-phosphate oxidase